jgi:hypothetical protein
VRGDRPQARPRFLKLFRVHPNFGRARTRSVSARMSSESASSIWPSCARLAAEIKR